MIKSQSISPGDLSKDTIPGTFSLRNTHKDEIKKFILILVLERKKHKKHQGSELKNGSDRFLGFKFPETLKVIESNCT